MDDDSSQERRLAARLERQLRMLTSGLAAEAVRAGVSTAEWLALCQLEETPGISLKALAAGLHMRVSTTSRLLQGLVDRGLVQSRRVSDNKRTYAIELTPLGSRIQKTAKPSPLGPTRQSICRLSGQDLATVVRILDECLDRQFSEAKVR